MISDISNKTGFSLIETIIYIALFTLLVGGGLATAYSLIRTTDTQNNKNVVNSEIDFVLRKIESTLIGTKTINLPASGTGSILSVTKYNGKNYQFRLSSTTIEMNSDGEWSPLTTVNVQAKSLKFENISGTPKGVRTIITIDEITATSTKFLR